MDEVERALIYAALAGVTIPLGALLAHVERIRPRWLEEELRHSVFAFGGGVLIAAVALVLVPEGMQYLSTSQTLAAFGAGGLVFFAIDRTIQQHGGSVSQLLAMLMDFIPESLALGALLATKQAAGLLLALLIALQNLPESFNAYRELRMTKHLHPTIILLAFTLTVLLGPLMAWIGFTYLRSFHEALGSVMLFAAGGIMYLMFQDIAPQAKLQRHWAPSLGAVAGFMLGLLGYAVFQ
jgi:ZIP family zinc transporter